MYSRKFGLALMLIAAAIAEVHAQVAAFPGAEGAGQYALGGRGGDVYHVTNLLDSGAGSLRFGIENATGPRTVVFDVGGTIDLASTLLIDRPNITIAGQTAPGGGITLKGYDLRIANTNDVIVRYLRVRPGDIHTVPDVYEPDSLGVVNSQDIMIDHVSASWSTDEVLSVTHESNNVTVQWSIISEALHNSNHSKGNHGFGSLINGGDFTFHHNLYAHNRSRNPRPSHTAGVADVTTLDFVNNVIYNPGDRYGYGGGDEMLLNFVNNYGISGPNTSANRLFVGASTQTQIYQSGNFMDLDKDGTLDGQNRGWSDFSGTYSQSSTRFNLPLTTIESAADALQSVLDLAGASRYRDAVDTRVVNGVLSIGTSGSLLNSQDQVGGWPTIPGGITQLDSDQDGMPDIYEESVPHLNPFSAADRNFDGNANGYTDLEDYLHSLTMSATSVSAVLRVDRNTGAMTLHNDDTTDLGILGYVIYSSLGALEQAGWRAIARNYDVDGPNTADGGALIGTVDANDAWTVQSLPRNHNELRELQIGGDGGMIAAGDSVVLSAGGAWIQSSVENDLTMELVLSNGTTIFVPIAYIGNNGSPLLRSDFNADGSLTAADWDILRQNHPADLSQYSLAQSHVRGDLDGDQDNDVYDFLLFRSDFIAAYGESSFNAMLFQVPEPSTIMLVVLAHAILIVRKVMCS